MSRTRDIIIVVLAVFFRPALAYALDFRTVDFQTSRLFNEQKWDSVISIGKEALHENIDYFYLRQRMGISYYHLGRYFPAIEHLEKAGKFNSSDPVTREYLYLSYAAAGREDNARALAPSLDKETKQRLRIRNNVFDQVDAEGGAILSSENEIKDNPYLMGKDSIAGEKDVYRNSYYGHLGINLNIGSRVSVYACYNYMDFLKVKYFQNAEPGNTLVKIADSVLGKQYIYSHSRVANDTSFQYNMTQHEAYLSVSVILPKGFRIRPAFHFLNVRYTNINVHHTQQTIMDTARYMTRPPGYILVPFVKITDSYTQSDTSFGNYLGSLAIDWDIKVFRLTLSGSISNLNAKTQTQGGFSLTYYPLGSAGFYGVSAVTAFFESGKSRLIFQQTLGGEVLKRLWIEGMVISGYLSDANLSNGYLVYNITDAYNYGAGANLSYYFSKHLGISFTYQFFNKESTTTYMLPNPEGPGRPVPATTNSNYYTNTLIGGIKWKL